MDEEQVIDDALRFLRHLRDTHRNQPMEDLASLVIDRIRPSGMAFDSAGRIQRLYSDIAKSFAEEAAKLADQKDPEYETPIFRCYRDFEKCKRHSDNSRMCYALLVLCIQQQLNTGE
jgi:hypothetical protein